jgi:hypothetical protein
MTSLREAEMQRWTMPDLRARTAMLQKARETFLLTRHQITLANGHHRAGETDTYEIPTGRARGRAFVSDLA